MAAPRNVRRNGAGRADGGAIAVVLAMLLTPQLQVGVAELRLPRVNPFAFAGSDGLRSGAERVAPLLLGPVGGGERRRGRRPFPAVLGGSSDSSCAG
jgi:hypothetical protein